ncbi:hypothetical protein GY45DRAFT_1327025 [Cubamyces sp. BRFM 1775]|nr:hypothetical protein GY45DRAFT_1327025 [Cubamyces sp. BRFM 1775]
MAVSAGATAARTSQAWRQSPREDPIVRCACTRAKRFCRVQSSIAEPIPGLEHALSSWCPSGNLIIAT